MELGKTWEQGGKKKRERGKMRSKGEQGGHQGTPRGINGDKLTGSQGGQNSVGLGPSSPGTFHILI